MSAHADSLARLTTIDTSGIRLCPAMAFDRIAGGRYKLRILWTLTGGERRYGEIARSLARGDLGRAVTPRILSRELKELQAHGLIRRRAEPTVPARVSYRLTERGHTLLPVLEQIVRWGLTGAHEQILSEEAPVA